MPVHAEIELRKSRFIGIVTPVDDRDAAMRLIDGLRLEHRGAAHVCWALMAGGQSGMSDDGEPSGTAGRPILEVLRHHELDGVLAAVVRYYGGIKLGAGGLARAYTDAVAAALKPAQRVEQLPQAEIRIDIPYSDESRVRHWLAGQPGHVLTGSEHGSLVRLFVRIPVAGADFTYATLGDITQGRAHITENR